MGLLHDELLHLFSTQNFKIPLFLSISYLKPQSKSKQKKKACPKKWTLSQPMHALRALGRKEILKAVWSPDKIPHRNRNNLL